MLQLLAAFGRGSLDPATFVQNIDNVDNGMLLEPNSHLAYDRLEWSLEAIGRTGLVGPPWTYRLRFIPQGSAPMVGPSSVHFVGREGATIAFGGNDSNVWPDPNYCNTHLALSRVIQASAMADVFNKYLQDLDDDAQDPSVGSGPRSTETEKPFWEQVEITPDPTYTFTEVKEPEIGEDEDWEEWYDEEDKKWTSEPLPAFIEVDTTKTVTETAPPKPSSGPSNPTTSKGETGSMPGKLGDSTILGQFSKLIPGLGSTSDTSRAAAGAA